MFVQTETGYVLGIELDRTDNANTVKRRLKLALNVQTEETSLVCGDTVLKNDLSIVRNDSPLLLTRNGLHRSSSTPCFSPSGGDLLHRDLSGPIEIIGCSSYFSKTKALVTDIVMGMRSGVDPVPTHSGLGGAYVFRNCNGDYAAIVKPTDEEPFAPNNPKGFVGKALGYPGLKRSVRVGETGFREVAAYLLDHESSAKVPLTALVKVTHQVFHVNDDGVNGNKHQDRSQTSKIASIQQYISHDCDANDYGTSSFPVSAVHRIGILDIRILNTDRHAGNLLVRKLDGVGRFGLVELVPIDHGLCLPESLEDPYFEWIHWPQASIPFSEDELEYIFNLDPVRDAEMLRMELPMIREACLRVLILCTIFLKKAADAGLCLAEIGEMMSREYQGHEEAPSELEILCVEARRLLLQEMEKPVANGPDDDFDQFQFDFDCEDGGWELGGHVKQKLMIQDTVHNGIKVQNGRKRLCGLEEEDVEGEDTIIHSEAAATSLKDRVALPLVERQQCTPFRVSHPGEKSWQHQGSSVVEGISSYWGRISSGNRSVNGQLPESSGYVKLSDMTEEEWNLFLDNFQKLLHPTLDVRRSENLGLRQRQRLGTSCRF